MESVINFAGAKVDADSAAAMGELITTIFTVAANTNMEQKTVRKALHHAFSLVKVENVSIAGCSITGDKTVNT